MWCATDKGLKIEYLDERIHLTSDNFTYFRIIQ